MEKRILVAFILSFAVLYGFRYLYPPPAPPPEAPQEAPAPLPVPVPPPAPQAPSATDVVGETAGDTEIPTDLYTATISSVGGVLKSFRLKEYTDSSGKPIELINAGVASKVGWPLAIASGDAALDKKVSEANFRVQQDQLRVSLEFAADGVHATKVLEFNPEKYSLLITTSLTRGGSPVPHQVVWQGGFGDQSIREALADDPAHQQAIHGDGAKFQRLLLSSVKEPQDVTASLIGVEDQYFLAMIMMPQAGTVRISKSDFSLPNGTAAKALYVAAPGGQQLEVFIGPKQPDTLTTADPRLTAVPNYGWFGFITKPLIFALKGIHHYVGNYGWAIVILTILINVVMFPLRVKQQVSMQKMQKLAPHMRTLQEKYKKLKAGDPKRTEIEADLMKMNKEQMSGCLPSLLQMPLLFAFWSMLSVSIELRRAPWILWIDDLSRYDHYYILPILMGVSMFISQKMTPTTMDPAQAKMMMIMPLIFLGFFLWAQSGVALYWLTSTLVGIGQQQFIRKYWSEDSQSKVAIRQRKPQGG